MKTTYLPFLVAVASAAPVNTNRINAVTDPSRGLDLTAVLDGIVGGISPEQKGALDDLVIGGEGRDLLWGFLHDDWKDATLLGDILNSMELEDKLKVQSLLGTTPDDDDLGKTLTAVQGSSSLAERIECQKPVDNLITWFVKLLECGLTPKPKGNPKGNPKYKPDAGNTTESKDGDSMATSLEDGKAVARVTGGFAHLIEMAGGSGSS